MYSSLAQRTQSSAIDTLMARALDNPDILSLAIGLTDNTQLPVAWLHRAWEHLLRRYPRPDYLQYGPAAGRLGLREAIVQMLRSFYGESSPALKPEALAICNGAQQALYLMVQALCDPGDIVLVQNPTYFVFLDVLRSFGVVPCPVPCTSQGSLDAAQLEVTLAGLRAQGLTQRVKAVYLVSYFANPQGHCLSMQDKSLLGEALERHGLRPVIVEDAAYRELYFGVPCPALSIYQVPSLQRFPLLYVGTFTKPLATGLKVGFVWSSDKAVLEKMLQLKAVHDFGSPHFNQALIEVVLQQGWYSEILTQARGYYAHKASSLHEALLHEELTKLGWRWEEPGGGLFLWLRGPFWLDAGPHSKLCDACLRQGVLYLPGALCYATAAQKYTVRLSWGHLGVEDLRKAAHRFAQAMREVICSI